MRSTGSHMYTCICMLCIFIFSLLMKFHFAYVSFTVNQLAYNRLMSVCGKLDVDDTLVSLK